MKISHICGSIVIQAKGAFLNGSGSQKEGKEDISMPKTYLMNNIMYPYVSAQCWRRWWKESYTQSLNELINQSPEELKLQNLQFVNAIEDVFGYFEALEKKITIDQVNKINLAIIRSSPLQITQFNPIQSGLENPTGFLVKDKAFVHLKDGTPLPYSSRCYNADLESIIGIDITRLGVYKNFNDRQEIAGKSLEEYLKTGVIKTSNPNTYIINNYEKVMKLRIRFLFESLLTIYGGAKSPQYGADITPKVLILTRQYGGNPILSNLFEMGDESIRLKIDELIQKTNSFPSLIDSKVYVGIRSNYLENLDELIKRADEFKNKTKKELVICTPAESVTKLLEGL
jgi:CRISPR-associated protein Cst2